MSGNPSTSRMRVAAHDLQTTGNERAFFALMSPTALDETPRTAPGGNVR